MPTMLHNINSQQMPRAVENHIKAINQVFCTHLQKSGRNREKEGKKEIHFDLIHFERIILTLVFSSVSIGLAFFSSFLYGIAYSMTYSFCEKDENNDDFEHALILPSGISENFLFSFEFIFV